jgi:catechol 2,3-dioxygenase-like lactoylglutathione lyase family enzyme
MATNVRLCAVTIDCPDPVQLALFYQQFLGGTLHSSNNDFVVLSSDREVRLDFQRVPNNQPPPWPNHAAPRRLHLDFIVDDLNKAEIHLLGLGAAVADFQPGGDRFRVLLDPAGHPFCLATAAAAAMPSEVVAESAH